MREKNIKKEKEREGEREREKAKKSKEKKRERERTKKRDQTTTERRERTPDRRVNPESPNAPSWPGFRMHEKAASAANGPDPSLGFRVQRFRVQGLGVWVQGLGFRV